MALLIAIAVFLVLAFGLAAVAGRRRRGNRGDEHGALDQGMAGRYTTGATVTRNAGGQPPAGF